MMKRILQNVLLGLMAVPASLSAVVVPQTSAADYIFTVPRLTNHIHGVLVDTTNAYRVIRSEDIDWLREAFDERLFIHAGHMPSTNGRSLGVGPEVKFGDAHRGTIGSGWLDGDAPLLDGCRLYDATDLPAFTNIYERVDHTNGVTNVFSVIEMPMTNGTTSVFTNRWTCEKKITYTTVVTNIHEFDVVDMCHGVAGEPFPAYSNAAVFAWWRSDGTRIQTVRDIADAREVLRGTVRLADVVHIFQRPPYKIKVEEYGREQTYTRITTNWWETSEDYLYITEAWGASCDQADPYFSGAETRFDTSLVTSGGVSRVAVEAAYAHCHFYYHHRNNQGSGGYFITVTSTDVVIRLADPTLDVSGAKAICRVWIDAHDICLSCAAAAGVPEPTSSLSYRELEGHDSLWSIEIDEIVIFYRITPSTKLPDW